MVKLDFYAIFFDARLKKRIGELFEEKFGKKFVCPDPPK